MDGVMVTAVEISIRVVMGKFDRHVGPKNVSFLILLLGRLLVLHPSIKVNVNGQRSGSFRPEPKWAALRNVYIGYSIQAFMKNIGAPPTYINQRPFARQSVSSY
jgi:hypothetical protein